MKSKVFFLKSSSTNGKQLVKYEMRNNAATLTSYNEGRHTYRQDELVQYKEFVSWNKPLSLLSSTTSISQFRKPIDSILQGSTVFPYKRFSHLSIQMLCPVCQSPLCTYEKTTNFCQYLGHWDDTVKELRRDKPFSLICNPWQKLQSNQYFFLLSYGGQNPVEGS